MSKKFIWYSHETCFIDGHVDITGVATIVACGNQCMKVSKCVGVVYAPHASLCWLKSAMAQRLYNKGRQSMVVVKNE